MGKRGPKKGHGGRPRKRPVEAGQPEKKKPGPKKGEGGRPPKLVVDDKLIKRVETMAGLGLTLDQIALIEGVGERTMHAYKSTYQELSAAYKRGRANGVLRAVMRLRDHIEAGDRTSLIFFLKTQACWSEVQKREISGPEGKPIEYAHKVDYSSMSDDQLIAMIAEEEDRDGEA